MVRNGYVKKRIYYVYSLNSYLVVIVIIKREVLQAVFFMMLRHTAARPHYFNSWRPLLTTKLMPRVCSVVPVG